MAVVVAVGTGVVVEVGTRVTVVVAETRVTVVAVWTTDVVEVGTGIVVLFDIESDCVSIGTDAVDIIIGAGLAVVGTGIVVDLVEREVTAVVNGTGFVAVIVVVVVRSEIAVIVI